MNRVDLNSYKVCAYQIRKISRKAVHCGRHWHKYEIFYANTNCITQKNTLVQSFNVTSKRNKVRKKNERTEFSVAAFYVRILNVPQPN